MTDSNEKKSADAQQDSEQKRINETIIESITSIIQDGSAKDLIMGLKQNSDSIAQYEFKVKMAIYIAFFVFIIILALIGGGLLFWGDDKVLGEKILFTAIGSFSGLGFGFIFPKS